MEPDKDTQIADLEESLSIVLLALKQVLDTASFPKNRQGQMGEMEIRTVYEQTKSAFPKVQKYIETYLKDSQVSDI